MVKLHPQSSDPVPQLPVDAPSLQQVDLEVLAKMIRKAANGSSPAGSGWTGDLLRPLVGDKECLSGIGYLIRDIISVLFHLLVVPC